MSSGREKLKRELKEDKKKCVKEMRQDLIRLKVTRDPNLADLRAAKCGIDVSIH
jgi:hypothetical protein